MRRAAAAAMLLALACGADAAPPPAGSVAVARYGTLADGRAVWRYSFANARGLRVTAVGYGAAITAIELPDGRGGAVNVVLAPGDLAGLVASRRRYGAVVGRYAGRLRGAVTVDGIRYPLAVNVAGVTLHGGDPGFDRALWTGRPFADADTLGVTFTYRSPAGEQGFPATLTTQVRYALARRRNVLTMRILATADAPTVANIVHHGYFNLAGQGTVRCHRLQVDASRYVATDARGLPTGARPSVRRTPLDLRRATLLTAPLESRDPLIARPGGLDHMLILDRGGAVRLSDTGSGRSLLLATDQPGVQVYTANALDGSDHDASGRALPRHAGVALEAGHFPDSPAIAQFPSTRVAPGRPLHSFTRWTFGQTQAALAGACRHGEPT